MPPPKCLFEENHTEIDAAIASPFAAHVAITHEIDIDFDQTRVIYYD